MKTLFKPFSLLSITLVFIISVSSCKKKDNTPPDDPNNLCTPTVVEVTTDIDVPTVWDACHIYVISTTQISVSSTLTIEPGTIVKFKDIAYDNAIQVGNSGKIIAIGTAAKPIVFTSYKDDSHGGDNNSDGSATSPARGDWGGIIINSNDCQFKYCTFMYGGEGPSVGSGQPTLEFSYYYGIIDNCTFAYCGGETTIIGYGVVDARYCNNQSFSITNSVFYGNVKPLFLNPFLSVDNSNTFHNPGNPAEMNDLNGIFMTSEGNEATTDVSWAETEVPFVLTGSLAIGTGLKLILAPDVIIKVVDLPAIGYNKISLNDATSSIQGHDLSGVFFTSYFDDAHGGDTNGDGNSTSPGPNDWYGIQDITASIGTNNNCYGWGNILYATYP
jgi:hypothetical protein